MHIINITVLAVYSSVNSSAKQMADEINKFYSNLQGTASNVVAKEYAYHPG